EDCAGPVPLVIAGGAEHGAVVKHDRRYARITRPALVGKFGRSHRADRQDATPDNAVGDCVRHRRLPHSTIRYTRPPPSTFSEVMSRPSFFLSALAMAPRTVWCCHPSSVAISSMV